MSSSSLPTALSIVLSHQHSQRDLDGPTAEASAQVSDLDRILARVKDEQCAYVGIYKPGELGRGTWRAVLLDTNRRGRGYKGKYESIVLSTFERKGIDDLVEGVMEMCGPKGVRHIVNPHCDQDEGVRIVWSENGSEMGDWSRRDQMMREGKTVQAEERADKHGSPDEGLVGWDNTAWMSLRAPPDIMP